MPADWLEARWLAEAVVILFAAAAAALSATLVLAQAARRAERRRRLSGLPGEEVVFLFDGDVLLDATEEARRLLDAAPAAGSDFGRLRMLLLPRFPDLDRAVAAAADGGAEESRAVDQMARLRAESRGGTLRLALLDAIDAAQKGDSLGTMEQEVASLRAAVDRAPVLVWRQTPRGQITWVNSAYLEMIARTKGNVGDTWPPPPLFEPSELLQAIDGGSARRLSLMIDAWSRPIWFDCASHRVGDEILFIATNVDAAVQAEAQLREFRQTLTKTFAHLTIGLAIFDRTRHLALFNPALTDLTRLPIDFLAARPALNAFLDRLREKQMMPEPKDYKGWRRQLLELEAAAADGTYAETWSLPSGGTYRVTGRPHPDGAVAFLFEDISAEISLTRRFRSELELGQAVIDSLDEAIAVFSPSGVLAMANRAYARLWQVEPEETLTDPTVLDAIEIWRQSCVPAGAWEEMASYTARSGSREPWSTPLRLADGRGMVARLVPLAGGATLVGFHLEASSEDVPDGGDGTPAGVAPFRRNA